MVQKDKKLVSTKFHSKIFNGFQDIRHLLRLTFWDLHCSYDVIWKQSFGILKVQQMLRAKQCIPPRLTMVLVLDLKIVRFSLTSQILRVHSNALAA